MLDKSTIGVVIPAFNEGPVIGDVLRDITKVFSKLKTVIIVVNDGSSDNTAQVVGKHKNVVLVNHIINMGAGAATRTGLDCAKTLGCDYVVTVDSDGQHSSKDALKLIQALQKGQSDFIIGSRLINTDGMPWYRVVGTSNAATLTRVLSDIKKDKQVARFILSDGTSFNDNIMTSNALNISADSNYCQGIIFQEMNRTKSIEVFNDKIIAKCIGHGTKEIQIYTNSDIFKTLPKKYAGKIGVLIKQP